MHVTTDSKSNYFLKSSLWGLTRSLSINTLIYPLEVIKIHQQCMVANANCVQVTHHLFQKGGTRAFYKGLLPHLTKSALRVWRWPMITSIPPFLEDHSVNNTLSQIITGMTISTADAIMTTPFERFKVRSIFEKKTIFQEKFSFKCEWKGFFHHWMKLSANWTVFLVAQDYLRTAAQKEKEKSLSLVELTKIGVQVAIIVSIASAPFDILNTWKQSSDVNCSRAFKRNVFKLYRGCFLSSVNLIINNVASVILIDKLEDSL